MGDHKKTEYYPIIFVRGFDPSGTAVNDPFNGFNDGTAYVKVADNERDFPGFVISFLQDSTHNYLDTINILRFRESQRFFSKELGVDYPDCCFTTVQADSMGLMKERFCNSEGEDLRRRTFWVFNYYAGLQGNLYKRLKISSVPYFARELERYIKVVTELTGSPKVNMVAHSMGGVILRHLVQRRFYSNQAGKEKLNRVVTLGSPLAGITYLSNVAVNLLQPILGLANSGELRAMDPDYMCKKTLDDAKSSDSLNTDAGSNHFGLADPGLSTRKKRMDSLHRIGHTFRNDDWFCVAGTNKENYAFSGGSAGNALRGGGTSDGLVQLDNAYFKDSPRAFFHKPHGGTDSLIACRESYEAVTRFLFADHRVRLRIKPGSHLLNFNPDCNYYLGCTIKVRNLDFYLNERSKRSGNTFVIYKTGEDKARWLDFNENENLAEFVANSANDNLNVYEGFLDVKRSADRGDSIVFRIDIEVTAETLPDRFLGINLGHSDMKVLSKQFIFEYLTESGQLLLHRASGDSISSKHQRESVLDKAVQMDKEETNNGHLAFTMNDNLELENFLGSFIVEVYKR